MTNIVSPVAHLATIDNLKDVRTPQVRSCIIRELISPEGNEHLPLILISTDVRNRKIEQIHVNDTGQISWWIEPSGDQFRLTGTVSIVADPASGASHSGGSGAAFRRLSAGGFDWEAERVRMFDGVGGRLRASRYNPAPGSPMEGGYEELSKWPDTVPTTTGATTAEEKKRVEQALANFALLLVEPTHVDWYQTGVVPDRRTLFCRGDDEAWTETVVVP